MQLPRKLTVTCASFLILLAVSRELKDKFLLRSIIEVIASMDTVLNQKQATHIWERHMVVDPGKKKALFAKDFPLEDWLKVLSTQTWEDESNDMVILEKGFKTGHFHYFLYVFNPPACWV